MIWTGLERIGARGLQFVIEIIIARILTPSDYGLIGMLAIFMGIAQTFLDSGFANALIQKKDRSLTDYSTVFYFSITIGAILYVILYYSAPLIAEFYHQPALAEITRVYMLTLLFNGLTIVPTAKLTINLEFRLQAAITIIAILLSGIIGIYCAYNDLGVWALVWQGISLAVFRLIFIWIFSKWRPLLIFSIGSFKRLFSFGSKLLVSSLINNIYSNISTLIIGKVFQAKDLGYFTRANQFTLLPATLITGIVLKVNFPILSQLQDDDKNLISAYKTLLRTPVYILYPILITLSILAKPFIDVLLGDIWTPVATLIPILAIGYLCEPLTHINLNLLYVKGRSDLVMKLEFIKKPIAFVMLICAIPFGLKGMCLSMTLYDFIAFAVNCHYTKKLLNYGLSQQVKALLPILGYCIVMGLIESTVYITHFPSLYKLLAGGTIGIITYMIISVICKDPSFNLFIGIIRRRSIH